MVLFPLLACVREAASPLAPSASDTTSGPADDRPPALETSLGSTLVGVPSGTFDMGCTPEQILCDDDELDVHTVTLTRPFWIGETEVTQAEYLAVTGRSPSAFACDDCPVESLSWDGAVRFANGLSEAEGLPSCYACEGDDCALLDPYGCTGYRLPTEAEWEWAARCGEAWRYAGSDVSTEVGWYVANAEESTHPAAQLAPNACGAFDLSGNVYEYANDWFEVDYGTEAEVDPVGPPAGPNRVLRGGGWHSDEQRTRVANRYSHVPPPTSANLGFRLARSVSPEIAP